MSDVELAWAAGFYDGEGSFGIYTYGDGRTHFRFTVGQAGYSIPETLTRFREAVGIGSINGPYAFKKQPGAMPFWQYAVQKKKDIDEVVSKLWPYLTEPKRAQILDALENNGLDTGFLSKPSLRVAA
jgi:hypothetical protein